MAIFLLSIGFLIIAAGVIGWFGKNTPTKMMIAVAIIGALVMLSSLFFFFR